MNAKQTLSFAECYLIKSRSAKKAKKKFEMSFANFCNLKLQTHCAYSGIEFTKTGDHTFSFERIDCNVGYVDGNVIAVSKYLNTIRSNIAHSSDVDAIIAKLESEIGFKKMELIKLKDKLDKELLKQTYAKTFEPNVEANVTVVEKFKIRADHPKLSTLWHILDQKRGLKQKMDHHQIQINHFTNHKNKIHASNKKRETKVLMMANAQQSIQQHKLLLEKVTHTFKYGSCKSHKQFIKTLEIVKIENKTTVIKPVKNYDHDNAINSVKGQIAQIESWLANADKRLKAYPLIKNGLKRFENLSKLEKQALIIGYPVDTSSVKILKQLASNKLNETT